MIRVSPKNDNCWIRLFFSSEIANRNRTTLYQSFFLYKAICFTNSSLFRASYIYYILEARQNFARQLSVYDAYLYEFAVILSRRLILRCSRPRLAAGCSRASPRVIRWVRLPGLMTAGVTLFCNSAVKKLVGRELNRYVPHPCHFGQLSR